MKAIVTGAAGQDGTLLRGLLRERGFEILGLVRRAAPHGRDSGALVELDVTDSSALTQMIRDFQPDHIYHLAACHHSSEQVEDGALNQQMIETNFVAAHTISEAILKYAPHCRLLIAGSSQMYSATAETTPVNEGTRMRPSTFYGWTKAWARQLADFQRTTRGLFSITAILFNHESVLRSPRFVSRKITVAAARAKRLGYCDLHVKDANAAADWMSAEDAVEAMVLALSALTPQDYVIASGTRHTVRDILDAAFGYVGLDWRDFVRCEASTKGPSQVLVGDIQRIQSLGWKPRVPLPSLIMQMTEFDLEHSA